MDFSAAKNKKKKTHFYIWLFTAKHWRKLAYLLHMKQLHNQILRNLHLWLLQLWLWSNYSGARTWMGIESKSWQWSQANLVHWCWHSCAHGLLVGRGPSYSRWSFLLRFAEHLNSMFQNTKFVIFLFKKKIFLPLMTMHDSTHKLLKLFIWWHINIISPFSVWAT